MRDFPSLLRDLQGHKGNVELLRDIHSVTDREISPQTYSAWMLGARKPKGPNLRILLQYYRKVGFHNICGEEDFLRSHRNFSSSASKSVGKLDIDARDTLRWSEYGFSNLRLGKTTFNWLDKEGGGLQAFRSVDVELSYINELVVVPDYLREEIKKVEMGIANRTIDASNGRLFALSQCKVLRSANDERVLLSMVLKETSYSVFYAARKTETGLALMARDLEEWSVDEQPVEHLATGLGGAILLFTSDNKVLFTRRGNLAIRAGEYDVSVIEGMHPDKDLVDGTRVDLWRFCQRGIEQELGLNVPLTNIKIVSLGVDMDFYQWNFVGYAKIEETFDELKIIASREAKDSSFEFAKFISVEAHPEDILNFIKNNKIWASGVAATVYSLCHLYGQKEVFTLADEIFS